MRNMAMLKTDNSSFPNLHQAPTLHPSPSLDGLTSPIGPSIPNPPQTRPSASTAIKQRKTLQNKNRYYNNQFTNSTTDPAENTKDAAVELNTGINITAILPVYTVNAVSDR